MRHAKLRVAWRLLRVGAMKRTLLALLLLGGTALADEAPQPEAQARTRLVGVMLSTGQALVWDEDRGEYVITRMGDELEGGKLVGIELDHLVLERDGERQPIALQAPPNQRVGRKPKRMPALVVTTEPLGAFAALATADDPGAATPAPAETSAAAETPAAAAAAGPETPAAAAAGPETPAAAAATATPDAAPATSPVAQPTAPAPAMQATPTAPALAPAAPTAQAEVPPAAPAPDAVASPVATPTAQPPVPATPPVAQPTAPASAAPAAAPATPAPAATSAPTAPAAPALAAPAAAPATPPVAPALVISRDELDRELSDFSALSAQVAIQPAQRGFRLAHVQRDSFLDRIGLRAGDVVLRIAGQPINALEDAARAYAALRASNQVTVEVVRNGRAMALRYVISPAATPQHLYGARTAR